MGWAGMRGGWPGAGEWVWRGEAGGPPSILSNKALAYSGLPLQALMVYKGPVHSQPEQRRHPPSRILHQAAQGSSLDTRRTLFRPLPCVVPENCTAERINRWCLTTCKRTL